MSKIGSSVLSASQNSPIFQDRRSRKSFYQRYQVRGLGIRLFESIEASPGKHCTPKSRRGAEVLRALVSRGAVIEIRSRHFPGYFDRQNAENLVAAIEKEEKEFADKQWLQRAEPEIDKLKAKVPIVSEEILRKLDGRSLYDTAKCIENNCFSGHSELVSGKIVAENLGNDIIEITAESTSRVGRQSDSMSNHYEPGRKFSGSPGLRLKSLFYEFEDMRIDPQSPAYEKGVLNCKYVFEYNPRVEEVIKTIAAIT